MNNILTITCGGTETDYPGFDNLAIQKAVDSVSKAGGGEVLLSAGEYILADSVHLRSNVVLRGSGIDKTVLKKNNSVKSVTEGFCGYGHKELTVPDGSLFNCGDGIYVMDEYAVGFQATQTTITEIEGNTLFLASSLEADILKRRGGVVETIFSMIKGVDCDNVLITEMTLEGNGENNGCLEGCRGGAIFLIGCSNVSVSNMKITNFNGEGFSYQQCRIIRIEHSECSYNGGNGVHPGSGTVGMLINDCDLHHNKNAGVFYCLRICYNICSNNRIHDNGLEGITIGHRDDNIQINGNEIYNNGSEGIFFRLADYHGMTGRNVSVFNNKIYGNAQKQGKAQIYAPVDLTGFEMFNNEIQGEPFICEGEMRECNIGDGIYENARRIDIDNIPEKEYRHL